MKVSHTMQQVPLLSAIVMALIVAVVIIARPIACY
jgi:hypothetical protein